MTKTKQTFSIRETAEILIPDRLGRSSYLVAVVLILVMIAMISVVLLKLPSSIPLYFSLPWGEARLASKTMFYLIPGISVVFVVVNVAIGKVLGKLSPLLPQILAVSSGVICMMMLGAIIGIVQSLIL